MGVLRAQGGAKRQSEMLEEILALLPNSWLDLKTVCTKNAKMMDKGPCLD
jgi:hypothetical protein